MKSISRNLTKNCGIAELQCQMLFYLHTKYYFFFYYCSHIALRQDHYECSLLFLMRRARLDLRNKNDQLPVDCISVKNPKCATIIKLSTTLNDLMKDTPKYPLERIVCNDLTRGKENNPIQIVNDLDEAQEPHDYVYVKQNVVTTHVPIDRNISTLQVCIFKVFREIDFCMFLIPMIEVFP